MGGEWEGGRRGGWRVLFGLERVAVCRVQPITGNPSPLFCLPALPTGEDTAYFLKFLTGVGNEMGMKACHFHIFIGETEPVTILRHLP